MKKLFATFLILTVVITACKKEGTGDSKKLDKSVQAISAAYLKKISENKNGVQPEGFALLPIISSKVLRVVSADLMGALGGASSGATLGDATGVGAIAGAIIGAVIGGVNGSIKEAGKGTPPPAAPPTEPDYSPSSNSNNPYDAIGAGHYTCINKMLVDFQGYYASQGYFRYELGKCYNYCVTYFASRYLIRQSDTAAFTLGSCDTLMTIIDATSSMDLNTRAAEFGVSSNVLSVLSTYFDCLEASLYGSVQDFVDYSVDAEDAVNAMTSLTSIEKEQVLIVMATARYGVQFWCSDFFQ